MTYFKMNLDGDKEDAKILDQLIVDLDDEFEPDEDPQTDIWGVELYWLDNVDVMVDFATKVASALPDCDFIIKGYVSTIALNDQLDDFIIEYRNKKLTIKDTGWYVRTGEDVPFIYEYEIPTKKP